MSWDGKERRQHMSEEELRSELKRLEIQLATFTAKVSEWMEGTTEYRRSLCSKIDCIKDKFEALPCKERQNIYDSISAQVKVLWVFVTAIVLAILGDFFRGK